MPISKSSPTIIDLFSGAGGTAVGFKEVGFQVLGAIEINKSAIKTYEENIKIKVKDKSIIDVSPSEFREEIGVKKDEIDVIVGCPPCQGFSRMRCGNGQNDSRNQLVVNYLNFVKEFMPKFAVFENVPGIIRYGYARDFYQQLCNGLNSLGYSLSELEENARDYGTPQNRKRVIVVASSDGEKRVKLQKTHGNPKSKEVISRQLLPWETVRKAIGNNKYPIIEAGQNGEREGAYPNHIAPTIIKKRVRDFIELVPHNGGSRTDVPKEYWLPCHLKNPAGHIDVYGRMVWDQPANTLTCGCTNISKGRFVHPEQDRAISYREAAALQGFEDDFVFYGKEISMQIGNAVPPPLSKAIANAIKDNL